jgi:hypothetical protein
LHDCFYFESIGLPTAAVISSEFEDAAAEQARRLGMPSLQPVVIPHPIQDRTDAELEVHARAAIDSILSRLTA